MSKMTIRLHESSDEALIKELAKLGFNKESTMYYSYSKPLVSGVGRIFVDVSLGKNYCSTEIFVRNFNNSGDNDTNLAYTETSRNNYEGLLSAVKDYVDTARRIATLPGK